MALRGRVVAITRPPQQAGELAKLILKHGGRPYLASTLEIGPVKDISQIARFVNRLEEGLVDYVVFMSRNGVRGLLETSNRLGVEVRLREALRKTSIVAVGPKTEAELRHLGVKVQILPPRFSSEGLLKALGDIELQGKVIAIPRVEGADPYLGQRLKRMGAEVWQLPVYSSTPPTDETKIRRLVRDILAGKVDIITFTSSATVKNLFKVAWGLSLGKGLREALGRMIVAVIGPTTERTLKRYGAKADVMPLEYTVEAMVKALVEYMTSRRGHQKAVQHKRPLQGSPSPHG